MCEKKKGKEDVGPLFFSSRRRHTRCLSDWSSDVCSSDLVRRNAYGRQADSSIREGRFLNHPTEMVFIRAPKIERVGEGVEVIATEGNDPVLGQIGRTLAAGIYLE